MTVSEAELRQAVGQVAAPGFDRTVGHLNLVKNLTVADGRATVEVVLPIFGYSGREKLAELITQAVRQHDGSIQHVDVNYSVKVKGKETGGAIGLRVKNVLAVGSGKGGVGKSTVASTLAFGLKNAGARVGLLDADVYGPSIPHLVGAKGQPGMVEHQTPTGQVIQRMVPIEQDGLKLMSIGFLVSEDQAVIWRGPMLHKLLTQFMQQTDWGELDYLVIDMPPGTGDVSLTLSQLLGLSGAVVVCTPQQVALLDAVKAINMFKQVKIPVLGMVENMTGDIFGRGGARQKAEQLGIPFLGEIPIDAQVRIQGDAGRIGALYDDDSPVREPLRQVCERVAVEIARSLLDSPAMPTLEIL